MTSLDEVHQYWQLPYDSANTADKYTGYKKRTAFLLSIMQPYILPSDAIIELGCNVGRNLEALRKMGYADLSGVDISKAALTLGALTYPELYNTANMCLSSIEQYLIATAQTYDVIFTLAVLEHIHPDSEYIFDLIADRADRLIVTVEDEHSSDNKHYPRNYQTIFEQCGWKQIHQVCASEIDELDDTFIGRVFVKR